MEFQPYQKSKIKDFIFFHFLPQAGFLLFCLSRICRYLGIERKSILFLLTSIRFSYSSFATRELGRIIRDEPLALRNILSKPSHPQDATTRAIILSPPVFNKNQLKKGVMLLTFSHTFSFFLEHPLWSELNKYFAFVLEPSWAGYSDPDILAFIQEAEHCVIQASEINDRSLINSVYPWVPCMDTGASNWVDHDVFTIDSENVTRTKIYDSIYIANLNPIKRVYRAVDSVLNIREDNPNYKMLIVCASWGGGDFEKLNEYIKIKGVEDSIILRSGMPQSELVELIASSKCSVLLSLKEGSNRVLFESMFVNVPVVCLAENIGVNKSYINCDTGLLVKDSFFENALRHMSKSHTKFRPREWALNNISPEITTTHLSNLIDASFGPNVNSNLEVKVNSPEVSYKNVRLRDFNFVESLVSCKDSVEFEASCRKLQFFFDISFNSVASK